MVKPTFVSAETNPTTHEPEHGRPGSGVIDLDDSSADDRQIPQSIRQGTLMMKWTIMPEHGSYHGLFEVEF